MLDRDRIVSLQLNTYETPQTTIERVPLRTEIVGFNLHENSDYTYLFRPDMSVNLYIFHRHPLNKAITNERKWEHFSIPKSTHLNPTEIIKV